MSEPIHPVKVDAPTDVDGLERSHFTRYLLKLLLQVDAQRGAVVGLEGEWGSGKTWVLRQLESVSEEQLPRPVFLHFNPWMVSGAHDLVGVLLGQLSRQLAEHGLKTPAGDGKTQIAKAVADFPNVVYLLAYEIDTLAHAAEKALDVKDGRAYLEKIVQLPVRLPELPARRQVPFAERTLRQVLPAGWNTLPEQPDIESALSLCAGLLGTPRDVVRLSTRLAIVLPTLQGEVNLADVIVAEAIVLKVPQWLPWMRVDGRRYIHLGLAVYDETQDALSLHRGADWPRSSTRAEPEARENELQDKLYKLCAGHASGRPTAAAYRRALTFLIDELNSGKSSRIGSKRLTQHRHRYRWLCLTDSQEPMTTQDLQRYAQDHRQARADGWLDSPATVTALCAHFCDLQDIDLTDADAVGWARAFVEAESDFGRFLLQQEEFGLGVINGVRRLLGAQPVELKRREAISVLLAGGSLDFSASFLLRLAKDNHAGERLTSGFKELTQQWVERLTTSLSNGPEAASDFGPLTLLNWAALAGATALHELHDLSVQTIGQMKLTPFFGELWRDSPVASIPWLLMPNPSELVNRIESQEPDFKATHNIVWNLLSSQAQADSPDWRTAMDTVNLSRKLHAKKPTHPPPAPDPA